MSASEPVSPMSGALARLDAGGVTSLFGSVDGSVLTSSVAAGRSMPLGESKLAVEDANSAGRAVGVGANVVYTKSSNQPRSPLLRRELLPAGKRPVFPVATCFPKYHPSPKPSSSSTSSILSPRRRVNSSSPRASNSSAQKISERDGTSRED